MKLAFITNKVTQSLPYAPDFAAAQNLHGLELLTVKNTAIDTILPAVLDEWKKKLEALHMEARRLASTFYKCNSQNQHFNWQCCQRKEKSF